MLRKTNFSVFCRAVLFGLLGIILIPASALAFPKASTVNQGSNLVTMTWEDQYGSVTINKWMLKSDGVTPADWLGRTFPIYNNKTLQEVINFIYCDPYATSEKDAKNRLNNFFSKAGFPSQVGHSGGYMGYISGNTYDQMPDQHLHGMDYAYSDGSPLALNNHGRVFGPYYTGKMYVFIAALSREAPNTHDRTHDFVSFNEARDTLGTDLRLKAGFDFSDNLQLFNQIPSTDPSKTTGDHDEYARHVWAPK